MNHDTISEPLPPDEIAQDLRLPEDYDHMFHLVRDEVRDEASALRLVQAIAENFGGDYLRKIDLTARIRNAHIVRARRHGVRTRAIAERWGLSQRQVQRIVRGVVPQDDTSGLPSRMGWETFTRQTSLGEAMSDRTHSAGVHDDAG